MSTAEVTGQDMQTLTDEDLQVDLGVDDADHRARTLEETRRVQNREVQAQQIHDPQAKTTLEKPAGSLNIDQEARAWLKQYLHDDVQVIQEHRQHHIHIPNEKGERVPLTHCKRKDNPSLCKADFPRTKWFTDTAVVLCKCLLEKMDMPSSGRRNKIGSLHGPLNNEWLNGTHPGMLAAHRFNSDV